MLVEVKTNNLTDADEYYKFGYLIIFLTRKQELEDLASLQLIKLVILPLQFSLLQKYSEFNFKFMVLN